MSLETIIRKQKIFLQKKTSFNLDFRLLYLKKLKCEIQKNENHIYQALKNDLGKSRSESYLTEIQMIYKEIDYVCKHLKRWARPTSYPSELINYPSKNRIMKEPYGCVLIIAPWNYPLQLSFIPLISAIAAGNSVVLKPSKEAYQSYEMIKKIIQNTFPIHYVYCIDLNKYHHNDILQPKYDYIFFTGGTVAAKEIYAKAAQHLTPVTLELGGKSPCIIDETANLEMAAKRIVWGKYINAGQTCIAPDYLCVHVTVKEKLITLIKQNIIEMYGEKPIRNFNYPKIVNLKQFERLEGLIKQTKNKSSFQCNKKTLKISPVLFYDCQFEDLIMKEEIFGPILPIIEYNDYNKLIATIRNLEKPLALYLFSNQQTHINYALNTVSFGGACINDTLLHVTNIHLPFGGVGFSGFGSYHGKYGFDTFTHVKSVMRRTKIDNPLRYKPNSDRLFRLIRFLLK